MALKSIIGQEKAIAILTGIMQRQRLAGAYLFAGEPGIGKRTTAMNFAKTLNCLNLQNISDDMQERALPGAPHSSPITGCDACDSCDSCMKIDAGSHPDVLVVSPEDRQIRIEEIRLINDALSFRPFEGKRKVVIVDDAETMNISAANAFLKTLEEPPEDSLILLISSRPDRLPSTIRSRCSRINFGTLSLGSSRRILEGKIPGDEIEHITRLSLGRPGLAVSSDVKEERDWFLSLLKDMMHSGKDGWASREEMEKWFDLALTCVRDFVVLAITGNPSDLVNADIAADLRSMSKSARIQGIIDVYRELALLKSMLVFNLNKSITWNYTAALLRKELTV